MYKLSDYDATLETKRSFFRPGACRAIGKSGVAPGIFLPTPFCLLPTAYFFLSTFLQVFPSPGPLFPPFPHS